MKFYIYSWKPSLLFHFCEKVFVSKLVTNKKSYLFDNGLKHDGLGDSSLTLMENSLAICTFISVN